MSIKMPLKVAATLLATLMAGTAHADLWPIYLYPSMFYSTSDSGRYAANDFGFQMSVGYQFNPNWSLEGVSEGTRYRLDNGSGYVDSHGASLQGTYNFNHFLPDFPIQPLAIGGLGWLHTDTPVTSYDTMTARGGVGALWEIPSTHLDVRTDAVIRHEFNARPEPGSSSNAQFNDFLVSLGLTYQFGLPLHAAYKPEAAPGSINPYAATPKPAMVIAPASLPAIQQAPEAPIAAQEAPKKQPRLSTGIPAPNDQDGDGVDDDHDKCPDTPPGAVVDADGCILYMPH